MRKPKKRRLQERFNAPNGWQWGSFTNSRGAALRYGHSGPDKPVAHVVFVEGLSDFAERNFELARDFNREACAFWTFDRQGQGLSGRMLKNRFKQHSDGFQQDAADIIKFVREVVPQDGAPVIVFGHSTGGMIALLAMHDAPELFAGGILTAPLLGMLNPAAKNKEAFWAAAPLPGVIKRRYIPGGSSAWSRRDPRRPHGEADYSSDPDRMKVPDYWGRRCKKLRTGSPTLGWAKAVCESIMKIRDPRYLHEIRAPVMIYTAGKDVLVNNRLIFNAVNHLPDATYIHFKDGKHDLPLETDNIRNRLIRDALRLAKKKSHADTAPPPPAGP